MMQVEFNDHVGMQQDRMLRCFSSSQWARWLDVAAARSGLGATNGATPECGRLVRLDAHRSVAIRGARGRYPAVSL